MSMSNKNLYFFLSAVIIQSLVDENEIVWLCDVKLSRFVDPLLNECFSFYICNKLCLLLLYIEKTISVCVCVFNSMLAY